MTQTRQLLPITVPYCSINLETLIKSHSPPWYDSGQQTLHIDQSASMRCPQEAHWTLWWYTDSISDTTDATIKSIPCLAEIASCPSKEMSTLLFLPISGRNAQDTCFSNGLSLLFLFQSQKMRNVDEITSSRAASVASQLVLMEILDKYFLLLFLPLLVGIYTNGIVPRHLFFKECLSTCYGWNLAT